MATLYDSLTLRLTRWYCWIPVDLTIGSLAISPTSPLLSSPRTSVIPSAQLPQLLVATLPTPHCNFAGQHSQFLVAIPLLNTPGLLLAASSLVNTPTSSSKHHWSTLSIPSFLRAIWPTMPGGGGGGGGGGWTEKKPGSIKQNQQCVNITSTMM